MSDKKEELVEEEITEETPHSDAPEAVEAGEDAEVKKAEEAEVDEVAQLQTALSEMEDKCLRAQAEMANMRNRFQKEREDLARYRSQDLAKELLPALDNLERALASDVQEEQATNLKKGIEMVYESLVHALKQAGIEEIPAMGETFDPTLHQAVQTVPATEEHQAEKIVQVLQKGYKLQERVLRPTMVVVAQ